MAWLNLHHYHFHVIDHMHPLVVGLLTLMLTFVMSMLRSCSAALTNLPHR